ncbi:hypothetical protein [Paraburkholderia sp. BR14320]
MTSTADLGACLSMLEAGKPNRGFGWRQCRRLEIVFEPVGNRRVERRKS